MCGALFGEERIDGDAFLLHCSTGSKSLRIVRNNFALTML